MLQLFAIGGGELGRGETLELDAAFVASCGKPAPRVLFLPTASGDPPAYAAAFRAVYQDRLGCDVDVLALSREPRDDEVRDRVAAADLVYVGGGNTRRMLAAWALRGLDDLLVAAAGRGTPLGGLSAGAICWFARAHSHADRSPLLPGDGCLPGLGFLPGVGAPHFSQELWRIGILRALLAREGGVGLGLDDHLAVQVQGDRFRVLACREGRAAHRFDGDDPEAPGRPRYRRLEPDGEWRGLAELTGVPATP